MSPREQEVANLTPTLQQQEVRANRVRIGVGLAFAAGGLAVGGALATHAFDSDRFAESMPFMEQAQAVVNNVDDGLGAAGAVLLPTSLLGIGAIKLASGRSARIRNIEKRSSEEAASDGRDGVGTSRRVLRNIAAGSLPVAVATGAAIGTLTTGIGAEITDGPNRPIEAFDSFAPGDAMITQYRGAMPMVTSSLTEQFAGRVRIAASERGVTATSFEWGLNVGETDNNSFTALTLGIQGDRLPAEMRAGYDCEEPIPVMVDDSAHMKIGSTFEINGVEARIVGETHGFSAIGREGIVMDQESLQKCINKNESVESHAIVLDTDPETAQEILEEADTDNETATVITKEKYISNSQDFWEGNSKPLTNTLALVGVFAGFIASGGYVLNRMIKNRQQLASRIASGESAARFRATELVRGVKDGLIGSTAGVITAIPLTLGVNVLQTGLKVGMGVHEVLVGYGVGLLSTVGGTLFHVARSKKIIDQSEHTR